MKRFFAALAALIFLFPSSAWADVARPEWITGEMISVLRKIGIDPEHDVEIKGNYRWEYVAKQNMAIGNYICPAGTAVDISKNLMLAHAHEETPCVGKTGGTFGFLKLSADGSAEPFP